MIEMLLMFVALRSMDSGITFVTMSLMVSGARGNICNDNNEEKGPSAIMAKEFNIAAAGDLTVGVIAASVAIYMSGCSIPAALLLLLIYLIMSIRVSHSQVVSSEIAAVGISIRKDKIAMSLRKKIRK